MKLADLGLKTKPATKYFDGGYVSFSTENQELFYQIYSVTKSNMGMIKEGQIRSKDLLGDIMTVKTIQEMTQLMELVQ